MAALRELVTAMDESAFLRLRSAVETGFWEDGIALTDDQRRYAMQATMLYQAWHGGGDDHLSIASDGQIIHKSKAELKTQFRTKGPIARFDHDDL
ncbi:MAG: DUF1315 family protein [Gammaproteobacteria bacterium]|nr:DUF1315 family protein [Gammaproteobacteria bacterium]